VYLDYFSALVDERGMLKRALADERGAPDGCRVQNHGVAGREGDRKGDSEVAGRERRPIGCGSAFCFDLCSRGIGFSR